ncbi:ChbG/HpnK family deacetylase [Agromyces sp. LHK192]|uniref:ChbG/HpnK family deacetylase n=1 Tax=Agromyces sp. LHK192 TaxID=2498704 RepID=UPI0013E38FD1|nr:ChbG/HpnK family deacetylase [Agromyces sp. LHK192]
MTRRLVITADDLGRDPAGDPAIVELAAEGLITATTAIVVGVGPTAETVAALQAAGIEPRLHATLSSERGIAAWHPLTAGASLGSEPGGPLPFDAALVGERAVPGEVAAELAAQLVRLRALGARPAALDSHAGTLYGLTGRSFVPEALALCARERIGFRLPRDLAPYLGAEAPAPLAALHEQAVAAADAAGVPLPAAMVTNRRTAGDLGRYDALLDDVRRMLAALPEGTSELFLHPAPEEEAAASGPGTAVRAWEFRLLRDPAFRAAIDAEDIELAHAW